ncbi:pyridoxal-phosphate dependent enzyme [Nostoc ellipsosporum NOK]|nr:pyridoxal-phosphate dependent enzyme [Nostoc ellipsosporum NOK]
MLPVIPEPLRIDNVQTKEGASLDVLRADLVHPVISGNKWFKLRYYLEEIERGGYRHVLTFGGAYSNHIIATAAAAHEMGLACTGLIRGERPSLLSPTLRHAQQLGMQLHFLSREDYKEKIVPGALRRDDSYVIPEGGYGIQGAAGAGTLLSEHTRFYSHICCATGTGTMMAGLQNAAAAGQQVVGISVLKNNHALENEIRQLLHQPGQPVTLLHQYAGKGYGKHTPELLAFMNEWYTQTGLPSDFVYTGKLFFAVNDLLRQGFFRLNSKILVIHSGGLQGNASLPKGTLIFGDY